MASWIPHRRHSRETSKQPDARAHAEKRTLRVTEERLGSWKRCLRNVVILWRDGIHPPVPNVEVLTGTRTLQKAACLRKQVRTTTGNSPPYPCTRLFPALCRRAFRAKNLCSYPGRPRVIRSTPRERCPLCTGRGSLSFPSCVPTSIVTSMCTCSRCSSATSPIARALLCMCVAASATSSTAMSASDASPSTRRRLAPALMCVDRTRDSLSRAAMKNVGRPRGKATASAAPPQLASDLCFATFVPNPVSKSNGFLFHMVSAAWQRHVPPCRCPPFTLQVCMAVAGFQGAAASTLLCFQYRLRNRVILNANGVRPCP